MPSPVCLQVCSFFTHWTAPRFESPRIRLSKTLVRDHGLRGGPGCCDALFSFVRMEGPDRPMAMKRLLWMILILGLRNLLATAAAQGDMDSRPTLVATVDGSGKIRLTWRGGRPSYQVQMRNALDGEWRNVGEPTLATTATVPIQGTGALYRVIDDYSARFELVFDSTWSAQTHPGAWPANAHWSGPVGGVHNATVHFWREGEVASEGIRLMAERGQQGTLASEIQRAIAAGNALFTFTASGLDSPAQRIIPFPKATTLDFPLLTLCSMIAPSPDWFAGVTALPLVGSDGKWIQEQLISLYGFDAGTDSGADFTSPDMVTVPRGVVTRFSGYPANINGAIVPFGTLSVRRIE